MDCVILDRRESLIPIKSILAREVRKPLPQAGRRLGDRDKWLSTLSNDAVQTTEYPCPAVPVRSATIGYQFVQKEPLPMGTRMQF